jgi:hypothetical protein
MNQMDVCPERNRIQPIRRDERHNMSKKFKPEKSQAENLLFNSALKQMSEAELEGLLDTVETLEGDFRRTPFYGGESIEAVAAAQTVLKIWNTEVDRILLDKQATDIYEQLHRWDNEGGMVDPNQSRRVVIRIKDGKRSLVWAEVDTTR